MPLINRLMPSDICRQVLSGMLECRLFVVPRQYCRKYYVFELGKFAGRKSSGMQIHQLENIQSVFVGIIMICQPCFSTCELRTETEEAFIRRISIIIRRAPFRYSYLLVIGNQLFCLYFQLSIDTVILKLKVEKHIRKTILRWLY